MANVTRYGRLVFGLAILALGVENLVCAQSAGAAIYSFAPKLLLLPLLPFLPPVAPLAYAVGVLLAGAGVGIASNHAVRGSALVVVAIFLVCLVSQVQLAIGHPFDLSLRSTMFEFVALGSVALLLMAPNGDGALPLVGRLLFALAQIVFGVTHLLIPAFIASLIPAWMPYRLFLAYFTGVAFIAAGVSIAAGLWARLGATLLGVMFGFWFLFLHAPRVVSVAGRGSPAEWSSAFIALGLCGASWIVAQAFPVSRTAARR